MDSTLSVGDTFPDITLEDHKGNSFSPRDYAGKIILLSFHPLAWTGVCAAQMEALEKHKDEFDKLGVVAIGVSVDSRFSKNAWARALEIQNTRMLADFEPKGALAKRFGIYRQADGFSERAHVLIDEEHTVADIKVYNIDTEPDIDEILSTIKKIKKDRQ